MEESKKGNKRWLMFFILFGITLLLCALCVLCPVLIFSSGFNADSSKTIVSASNLDLEYVSGDEESEKSILIIPITGTILNEKPDDFLSFLYTDMTFGYDVKNVLINAANDGSIKGVVLAIDSPGGTVTGSKAISDGVAEYIEKTGNPVVSHIMGLGASGGYWAAASGEYIVADSGSMIGSIGVIFGPFKYYNKVTSENDGSTSVSTENGIETYYITSGEYKDFGNPYRPMSDIEKQIMQEDTNDVYEEFVSYISKQRDIPVAKIKSDVKALPYGNKRSLELGLIDETGSRDLAYEYINKKLGLNGDYKIVKQVEATDFWSSLFSVLGNDSTLSVSEKYLDNSLKNKLLFLYKN